MDEFPYDKRIVAEGASPCPICGATKLFIKHVREGSSSEKRIKVAVQCSKCHTVGPYVRTNWVKEIKCAGRYEFPGMEKMGVDLIPNAIEKWNERNVSKI